MLQPPSESARTHRQLPASMSSYIMSCKRTGKTLNIYSFVAILMQNMDKRKTRICLWEATKKGTRNRNGHLLADFLSINDIHLTKPNSITLCDIELHGQNLLQTQRYNQIDYIIMQRSTLWMQPGILEQSSSYDGTYFKSDHRLVTTTFNILSIYIMLSTKIIFDNVCIKPILTYNLSCAGVTEAQLDVIDAAHRKHLRRLTNGAYLP